MTLVLTLNTRLSANSVRKERDDLADQLYQQLKEAIVIGVYREGDVMPTIAQLSEQLSVSPRTVQTAYTKLSKDELIASNRSLGTTVLKPPRQAIIEIGELYMTPVIERLRRLGLSADEAHNLIENLWKQWYGQRKGERRASDEVRTMEVTPTGSRPGERRAVERRGNGRD